MNILLVMPFMDFNESKYLSSRDSAFPIGLGYVAAALEQAGHHVSIFDFNIFSNSLDSFSAKVENNNFDVLGFSATTSTADNVASLARLCKKKNNGVIVIVGGAYPTVYPKELMSQCEDIDYEVIGEGELTIVNLLECIKTKNVLATVQGIAYRMGATIEQTQARPLIASLDDITFPAHHLFDLDSYRPPPGMFFRLPLRHMITSRGCPFNCVFCDDRVIWRGKCRMRSAQNIVAEMEVLEKKFGAREIHFYDDTFTVNKKRIYSLCDLLKKNGSRLIWRCSSRVDTIDKDMLKAMHAAGCRSISYGIESGDDEILKKMNKGTTVAQARDAVRWTNEAGIQAKGFFMLNFPGDTIASTEKTIAFAKELDLDFAGFNLTIPHHGDRLKKLIEKSYPLNEKAYYTKNAKLGNEIYFYQPDLPANYLKNAYKRAAREFYLRPGYAIRMLTRIKNIEMLKSYLMGFFRLFKIRID